MLVSIAVYVSPKKWLKISAWPKLALVNYQTIRSDVRDSLITNNSVNCLCLLSSLDLQSLGKILSGVCLCVSTHTHKKWYFFCHIFWFWCYLKVGSLELIIVVCKYHWQLNWSDKLRYLLTYLFLQFAQIIEKSDICRCKKIFASES